MAKRRGLKQSGEGPADNPENTDAAEEERLETVDLDDAPAADELPFTPEPAPTPAPAPEKKATPAPAPAAPQLPRVSFRVWAASCGIPLDQLAGFARYSEKRNKGPMTIPEWREALKAFRNRPVV